MFLRVDGAVIRIRDTRLFHRFTSTCDGDGKDGAHTEEDCLIHADIVWRELKLSDEADEMRSVPDPLHFQSSISAATGASSSTAATGVSRPSTVSATGGTDSRLYDSSPLSASALRPLLRNPAALADKIPQINAQAGVHQYYRLRLI